MQLFVGRMLQLRSAGRAHLLLFLDVPSVFVMVLHFSLLLGSDVTSFLAFKTYHFKMIPSLVRKL